MLKTRGWNHIDLGTRDMEATRAFYEGRTCSASVTKADLRDELRKLSLAERLELVEELWDSIAAECEHEPFPLTDEQRTDLERRLAEADADPAGGAPWEEVLERIRQRSR